MKEVKSFLWEAEAVAFVSDNDDLIVRHEFGKYVVYDVS